MRLLLTALIVTLGCGPTSRDGTDADQGPADACEGIECRVVQCEKQGRPPTTISGTVFAPNRTLAVYGANVYIPISDPGPMVDGAQCTRCQDSLPGGAAAAATSGTDGTFSLAKVPSGRNIPLIVQIGKWRRRIDIPEVLECTDNPLPPDLTALPRNRSEGDLPKIAVATGSCDALECLIRKLGVDDSEFTPDTGTGSIHLYASNGANKLASNNMPFSTAQTLWASVDSLKRYDLTMFSCECSSQPTMKPQAAMDAMKAYADLGGRIFMSHYHKVWIAGEAGVPTHAPQVWPTVAQCDIDEYDQGSGTVDQINNPKGAAFSSWLTAVGATTSPGTLPITELRQSCSSIDFNKAERWVYMQGAGVQYPLNFQFTTPNEAVETDRCGKVVFSDMHVASGSTSSSSQGFPMGCSASPMTPQEKALAFMFFDIASCVGPIL